MCFFVDAVIMVVCLCIFGRRHQALALTPGAIL